MIDSKTAAGVRDLDLTEALREELVLWRNQPRYTGPAIVAIRAHSRARS